MKATSLDFGGYNIQTEHLFCTSEVWNLIHNKDLGFYHLKKYIYIRIQVLESGPLKGTGIS